MARDRFLKSCEHLGGDIDRIEVDSFNRVRCNNALVIKDYEDVRMTIWVGTSTLSEEFASRSLKIVLERALERSPLTANRATEACSGAGAYDRYSI